MKKSRNTNKLLLALFMLLIFAAGLIAGTNFRVQNLPASNEEQKIFIKEEKTAEMGIPAVDIDGIGVVGTLTTRIRPGNGEVLVNVNNVNLLRDFQESARASTKAAANFMKTNLSSLDITYEVKVNASDVDGPSAGASMTTSIILALRGIKPYPYIMMTGTILEDGRIGRVGAISEKAEAARDAGATIFIVPDGQGSDTTSLRTRTCTMKGKNEWCAIKYEYGEVSIGNALNLTVIEAGAIDDIIRIYEQESDNTNSVT